MTLYNSIGQNYNLTRQADARIVERLINLLNLPKGSTIADVGAGTGNYSNVIAQRGYRVVAIEPSEVMRNQSQAHPHVSWLTAAAEQIPLPDNAVDGAIVMLALHHFSDIVRGISEINRIVASKIVIFAFEQSKIPDFWLTDYFPDFISDTLDTFPNTKEIAQTFSRITQTEVNIIPFLLPRDLKDLFAAAGWCQPEIYLKPQIRNGISTFSKMSEKNLKAGISRLATELDNGVWQQKYGNLLQQDYFDAGYRILVNHSLPLTKRIPDGSC